MPAQLIPLSVCLLLLLSLNAGRAGDFAYVTNSGAITITEYTGPGGNVEIPSSITGMPVTAIGYAAFAGHLEVTSITVSSSVTSIGENAFRFCTNLTTVSLPNSVTNIAGGLFQVA